MRAARVPRRMTKSRPDLSMVRILGRNAMDSRQGRLRSVVDAVERQRKPRSGVSLRATWRRFARERLQLFPTCC